jgi:hypothetical protein
MQGKKGISFPVRGQLGIIQLHAENLRRWKGQEKTRLNVVVSLTAGMEGERDFMRAHGKKQEGQRNVLPPQIFNGEKYCGVREFNKFLLSTLLKKG